MHTATQKLVLYCTHAKRPSRRLGGRACRRATARGRARNTRRGPGKTIPSTSCPGTLARQALYMADGTMVPQSWGWRAVLAIHEAASWQRPRTCSHIYLGCHVGRRGAARQTVGVAPCRATHARPTAEKKPVRRHRTQRAKARRVGPRRRRVPAPPWTLKRKNALKPHRNL